MKVVNIYICLLLCCFFLQNNTVLVDYIKEIIDPETNFSYFEKGTIDSKTDEKEADNESKENENKEENKEKEFKDIKYLNAFVCISLKINIPTLYNSEDAKIFKRFFEIETPPPRVDLTA